MLPYEAPQESLSLYICKAFLWPLLTYASPRWFLYLCITNITKLERLQRAASRAISGCLSSSPISLLLSEACLPPLRVTLTHFTLLSYDRALRLPTSISILDLARLGVKPRLCRCSWRPFASTHPTILPSTSPGEALFFETCFSLLWSPLFLFHASALILLFLAKVRPSLTLTFSHLTISFFGQTALFLFLLAKTVPAYLLTALSVALRPLFPFQQAQYAKVFLLKPMPFCKPFAGLGSTNKSATSFFLLSNSCSVLVTLFFPTSFLLLQTLWQIWQELSHSFSVLSGYNGSPDTRFFRGMT